MNEFYRRWCRPVVGAAIVGVAVWCAAGTVSVLNSETVSPRLVVAAPVWVAFLGLLLALLVPGWRTHPWTALPALLTTLPWWPVPIPLAGLLWTGPLAWVPIGAALLVAEGGRLLARLGRGALVREPRRATALAAAGALVVSLGAAWAADPQVPGGDEPHYLVITQSLLHDFDLQIENNHQARQYASYLPGTIGPDYIVRGTNGAIYSIHAPGVSALVLPLFAALGFRGAQLTLMLVFALTGALVWRTAWRLTGDVSAAWFAWASVIGCTTMVMLSFMVFPDAPGACAVAAAVWLMVSLPQTSTRRLVAVSGLLAALPWLHTRFGVLAGLLGLVIAVMLLLDTTRTSRVRWQRLLVFALVPTLSALAWFASFYVIYGTIDPRAPYGPDPALRSWIAGAVAGLFVDQQFGLFTYAPVLALSLGSLVVAAPREWRRLCAVCLGIMLAYAMVVATYWMWWAGVPALPARFLTAAVPLLALPLAVLWSRSGALGRTALLALLAVSLAITAMVVGVDRSVMAWNVRHGQAAWLEWLNPVLNLPRAWPSFFWNGEGQFGAHIGIVLTVFAVLAIVMRRLARGVTTPVVLRGLVALWLLGGAMLIVEPGWWLTTSAPLDASRAQMRVHAALAERRTVRVVGPGIRRWHPDVVPLRVRQDQPPLTDQPTTSVMTLVDVPAGAYRLHVSSRKLMTGDVLVRIGRSPEPLYRFTLGPSTQHDLPLDLPAGARVLVVEAPSAELASAWEAYIEPMSAALPVPGRAVAFAQFGETDVFFLDDGVYPEGDGFWVKGARTTRLVLSQGTRYAGRTRALRLRNGATPNTVIVSSGAWKQTLTLAESQEMVIELPIADALGSWPLTISTAAGFQPSVVSGSDDSRLLGVWVQLR
jgi:hypothetical protein